MNDDHFLMYHLHPDEFRSRRYFVTCGECRYRSKLYSSPGAAQSAGFTHCKAKNR